jgi:hypothetical protein
MNNVYKINRQETVLNIKLVHFYMFLLSRPLMAEIRKEIIRRCTNMQCAGCGNPVLEHDYDVERDIALNWKSNCAIIPSEKIINTVLADSKRKWPRLQSVKG